VKYWGISGVGQFFALSISQLGHPFLTTALARSSLAAVTVKHQSRIKKKRKRRGEFSQH